MTKQTPKPRITGRKQCGQLTLIAGFYAPLELARVIFADVTGKGSNTRSRRLVELLQLGLHYERILRESERPCER